MTTTPEDGPAGLTLLEAVGPAPHETMHVRCDCVPNLGPAHCHDCDVPYSECRARVAPVTPSGAGVLRQLGCMIVNCADCGDAAIGRVGDTEGGARCEGCAYDAGKRDRPAPSPDRETLIAEALDEASVRVDADSYYGDETDAEAAAKAAGFNAAMSIIEPYVQKLAALAVPPVVNKTKLAEIMSNYRHGSEVAWDEDLRFAARLMERQREWLGEER